MIDKLFKYFNKESGNQNLDSISKYLRSGNLKIGESSTLSCNPTILEPKTNFCNICIAEDCLIHCNISVYDKWASIEIGSRTFIAPQSLLFTHKRIRIGSDVMISWGCTIIDTDAHSLISSERSKDVLDWKKGWRYKDWSNVQSKPIIIQDKVWIGFNCIILKGVTIGEGAVVGAGSVVTKDIDPYTVVAGNPAKFIKKTS